MSPIPVATFKSRNRCALSALLIVLAGAILGCAHPTEIQSPPTKAVAGLPEKKSSGPLPAPDLASNPPSRAASVNANLPDIIIAGDSTAARGAGEAQQGWAVPFANYFDPQKINVINRARGGRSSRTFVTEGLWDQLLESVKPGDLVLIQFGHNDGGAVNDASRARGSLKGLGDETEAIDNLVTKKHEIVHTFGWYLRKMVADVKAKGATPIVLSLTVRDIWKDGNIERGSGLYGQWSAEVARTAHVPFIDLTQKMADQFDSLGEEKVKTFYPRDHTHFNAVGADLHAAAVIAALKGLDLPLVRNSLSAKGEAVPADPLMSINLPLPGNPKLPTLFLIGDSTVRNGRGDGANGQWGWGDFVGRYFDTNKLNVVNRAVGGTSSRTYYTLGNWRRVVPMINPGDFVMMQFGHNDNGALNDDSRARGTIKGVGNETQEIDNLLTRQHEVVHSYGWYLRQYISETHAKGATPIMCSLVPRKIWKDGKIVRNKDSYAGWAEQVAKSEDVPFLDLNELVADRYDALGPEKVERLFGDPHTHTSAGGAELNAQCVIAGLKALKNNPLAPYLRSSPP